MTTKEITLRNIAGEDLIFDLPEDAELIDEIHEIITHHKIMPNYFEIFVKAMKDVFNDNVEIFPNEEKITYKNNEYFFKNTLFYHDALESCRDIKIFYRDGEIHDGMVINYVLKYVKGERDDCKYKDKLL